MSIDNLNICFSGPSGSGKTTLCKFLKEEHQLNWISTSAWDVMNNMEKDTLEKKYGYKRGGHLNVIQLGHKNPEFAIAFQNTVRQARARQLFRAKRDTLFPGIVLDRSPLDNAVYMYLQSAMYMGSLQIEEFLEGVVNTINSSVDVIIFIPITEEQDSVEDNASRIASREYQYFVSQTFEMIIKHIEPLLTVPIYKIDSWDLQYRKDTVINILKEVANGKDKEETK
jgi:thymidylate kinase